ncbi:MAG TPA: hypothetical protein VLT36_09065 [Candidatus Dormibacteraeota bacterium]|nr:hypothetical protein [Candidatus Dormibacteraeota bacterium]
MKFCVRRFNTYFIAGLAILLACGCQSEAHKRHHAASTFSVFLETASYGTEQGKSITFPRDEPSTVLIEREPFLTEANVAAAQVVSTMGGFGISIELDRRGKWLLDEYSTANHGRRLVISTEFGPDLSKQRWLAAPKITHRMAEGILSFTPDASREECDQIVLGLNNVAKKVQDVTDKW